MVTDPRQQGAPPAGPGAPAPPRRPPPPPPRHEAPPAPPRADDDAPAPKKRRKHSFWKELPILVVLAFGIALLIKTFLLQAFFIPSASMEPTLKEGDRVLVEKVSYRFRDAAAGDVVVFGRDVGAGFSPPEAQSEPSLLQRVGDSVRSLFGFPAGTEQDFIKRVVAAGGDVVEGRDGRLYVNDEPVEEPYLLEPGSTSDFGPVDIPPGAVFVMGDNRANSDDSRSFGPVPVDTVVGRAFVLIWPPSELRRL